MAEILIDRGFFNDFIDVQDWTLSIVLPDVGPDTPVERFIQTTNITLDLTKNVSKRQLTDDTVDNVYSLLLNAIEGNIIVTKIEISDFIFLYKNSSQQTWRITAKNFSESDQKIEFKGEISKLRYVRDTVGVVEYYFRIECNEVITLDPA